MGFRYVRIKVLSGNVTVKKITSIPISSLHDQKIQFQSSNQNINKLIENTSWSQKANFIEVPITFNKRESGNSKKPNFIKYGFGFSNTIMRTWFRIR